ncbi:MAG: hypothetical protein ACLFUS_13665, partial [Candidatus Sumerlaeia bacterium]
MILHTDIRLGFCASISTRKSCFRGDLLTLPEIGRVLHYNSAVSGFSCGSWLKKYRRHLAGKILFGNITNQSS